MTFILYNNTMIAVLLRKEEKYGEDKSAYGR